MVFITRKLYLMYSGARGLNANIVYNATIINIGSESTIAICDLHFVALMQ